MTQTIPNQPSPYSDSSYRVCVRKTLQNRQNQNSSPVAAQTLKTPIYDLSILKPETWEQSRLCWYCHVPFHPVNKAAWQSHFCCTPHRQAFNKYGRLPFEKIMLALREEIRKQIAAQTHKEVLAKVQPIIERRVKEQEQEMYGRLKKLIAAMVLDPQKAVRELESLMGGSAN